MPNTRTATAPRHFSLQRPCGGFCDSEINTVEDAATKGSNTMNATIHADMLEVMTMCLLPLFTEAQS